MIAFKTEEEAVKWGQDNLNKYSYQLTDINGQKTLLCCDNRVYEEDIWGACYDILTNHIRQVGKENLPEFYSAYDNASELRNIIIDYIEKNTGIRYLDAWDEY